MFVTERDKILKNFLMPLPTWLLLAIWDVIICKCQFRLILSPSNHIVISKLVRLDLQEGRVEFEFRGELSKSESFC